MANGVIWRATEHLRWHQHNGEWQLEQMFAGRHQEGQDARGSLSAFFVEDQFEWRIVPQVGEAEPMQGRLRPDTHEPV